MRITSTDAQLRIIDSGKTINQIIVARTTDSEEVQLELFRTRKPAVLRALATNNDLSEEVVKKLIEDRN